jgi:allantoate deiminase
MDIVTRLAREAVERCHLLAGFSESSERLTRTFLSPPMRDCHRAISGWMRALGMRVETDAIGNLRGVHGNAAQRLIIGSHIDTVPNAGTFDGVLGVMIGLALAEALEDRRLPCEIEVIAFSEEEGVRFRTPFLGSRAVVGTLSASDLGLRDDSGVTMDRAIRDFGLDPMKIEDARIDPTRVVAFLEFHIEQGPVLDNAAIGLATVEGIAGQSRFGLTFHGSANHAGTTPMHQRQDALAGAAEWISDVEKEALLTHGLVATVGSIRALPNAGNVIPGEVHVSLDVRHAADDTRLRAANQLLSRAEEIVAKRGLQLTTVEHLNQSAIRMDAALVELAARHAPFRMVSGAGHDAMILAAVVPSVMFFLRSPGGISHHPAETVRVEDVASAIDAGLAMLQNLGC